MQFNYKTMYILTNFLTSSILLAHSVVTDTVNTKCVNKLLSDTTVQINSNALILDDNCVNTLHNSLKKVDDNTNMSTTLQDDNSNHTNTDDQHNWNNGASNNCTNSIDDKGNDLINTNCDDKCIPVVNNLCNSVRFELNDDCGNLTDNDCFNILSNISKSNEIPNFNNMGVECFYKSNILMIPTLLLLLII